MSSARNLNEYDHVMNKVEFCDGFWVSLKFTISSIKNKPYMILGIIKYWVYRILYGVEKTWVG